MKVEVPLLDKLWTVGVPASTLNCTVPVGDPASELTVTVTMPFAPYATAGALIVVVVAAFKVVNVQI